MQINKLSVLRICLCLRAQEVRLGLTSSIRCRYFSSNDEDKKVKSQNDVQEKNKKEDAKKKMNELLQSLAKMPSSNTKKVNLYKPQKKAPNLKPKLAKDNQEEEEDSTPLIDFSLRKAVKEVAESVEGDPKKTESELMASLRSHTGPTQGLSDLVSGMKFDSSDSTKEEYSGSRKHLPRSDQPESKLQEYRMRLQGSRGHRQDDASVELFGASPLGIFPSFPEPIEARTESLNPTWDAAREREKAFSVSHLPKNYFEELIQWTEQGKLWRFPIDNEIGLEEEKSFSFADHVFLEEHLEGWCPSKGPIRHFMELVCVGLSKNPHLTVSRKRAQIEWYKNYFEDKAQVLKDVGAI